MSIFTHNGVGVRMGGVSVGYQGNHHSSTSTISHQLYQYKVVLSVRHNFIPAYMHPLPTFYPTWYPYSKE